MDDSPLLSPPPGTVDRARSAIPRLPAVRKGPVLVGVALTIFLLALSGAPRICAGPRHHGGGNASSSAAARAHEDADATDVLVDEPASGWPLPPSPPASPPPHAPSESQCDAERCLCGTSYWTLWLVSMALLLMCNNAPPDLTLLFTTTALLLSGVIDEEEAWKGFSSPSILSIAVLFIVARALEETRCVELMFRAVLGRPASHSIALLRLTLPTAFFSAFMNNTPIVAMLLPVAEAWAARCSLSTRVLMMPLSFASLMGGMCTLIGSSTNMVLNARIVGDPHPPQGLVPFDMFTATLVGAPSALVGHKWRLHACMHACMRACVHAWASGAYRQTVIVEATCMHACMHA